MIEFQNVSRVYKNQVRALDDVSFHIAPGEFVFLIGESGAGKSTLIKLLLREEVPNFGKVLYQGNNVASIRARRIPRHRQSMGVVFQDFRLLDDRTVFDNISFALEIFGYPNAQIKRKVADVLELVDLTRKAGSYPNQLSGGERQRVSIARAMVNNPALLIADEPTGNLDPDTSWEILRALRDINNTGTTILMATHASDIVNRMRKRVLELHSGHLVRDEEGGAYSVQA
ncbi:MAG: cell division ATP-binding protein FtsE [Tissierellia bacterium]|nr:cell division ATP-binding protein FtsE [Bacillota bacterium]NLK59122.1 cell division ATP-binding protein FtsE [Tissierellia bacterium]